MSIPLKSCQAPWALHTEGLVLSSLSRDCPLCWPQVHICASLWSVLGSLCLWGTRSPSSTNLVLRPRSPCCAVGAQAAAVGGVDVNNSSHKGTPSYFLTPVPGPGRESGICNPAVFYLCFPSSSATRVCSNCNIMIGSFSLLVRANVWLLPEFESLLWLAEPGAETPVQYFIVTVQGADLLELGGWWLFFRLLGVSFLGRTVSEWLVNRASDSDQPIIAPLQL